MPKVKKRRKAGRAPSAREMAKRRWAGVTKEERTELGRKWARKRWDGAVTNNA